MKYGCFQVVVLRIKVVEENRKHFLVMMIIVLSFWIWLPLHREVSAFSGELNTVQNLMEVQIYWVVQL